MTTVDTINALLNEAAIYEAQAVLLRDAAKAISKISAKRTDSFPDRKGKLLSAVPVRAKAKKAKTGKKRKYTKKSAYWAKK